MDDTEVPTVRALTTGDMSDLMALVEEAGWNQTPRDWEVMLRLGDGHGLADNAGRIVASSMTLPYGDSLGWIGMVLVASDWRKRGCATRLLRDCIGNLRDAGRTAGLDATPAGQPVYERLGFAGTTRISRWRRPACTRRGAVARGIRPARADDLAWIVTLDAESFGTPRPALIHAFCADNEPMALTAGTAGFLLHRPGLNSRQIGALCAPDLTTAEMLLNAALAQFDESLVIDACDTHPDFTALLEANGFALERPFTRMYLGAPLQPGDPGRLFAIAGPELG